jgi:hypothetical protein
MTQMMGVKIGFFCELLGFLLPGRLAGCCKTMLFACLAHPLYLMTGNKVALFRNPGKD